MEYIIICSFAVFVSALTLFSGFGLGTLLMPAFAIFFAIPVAVAATAVVHLANNIFKIFLIGRRANFSVVIRFAVPAAVAAVFGATALNYFAVRPPLATYQLGAQSHHITLIKLIIAPLIILFALFDLLPRLKTLAFDKKYLPFGGMLSGFFGGLSGHQGALRSAFLIKAGLDKETFVGTGVVAAVIVDIARLGVYGIVFYTEHFDTLNTEIRGLILSAIIAAFAGSFIGRLLLEKVTLGGVQVIVGIMLIFLGICMGIGLL